MTEQLPSVFIGSSTEGLNVAREVELHLQQDAVPTIWKDGVFGLGSSTLESLMKVLNEFDFAVMVLSPDDLSEVRGRDFAAPRDNVLFELGLFMGKLGRDRVFAVHEHDTNMKLPTDLAGIAISPYRRRDDNNLSAALSPTCTLIIKAIRAQGFSPARTRQQIAKLQVRQDNTDSQVRALQCVVKGIVSGYEYDKLVGLVSSEPFLVRYHPRMYEELRRLHTLQYVATPTGRIHDLRRLEERKNFAGEFDLKEYVSITEAGREYLQIRSETEN